MNKRLQHQKTNHCEMRIVVSNHILLVRCGKHKTWREPIDKLPVPEVLALFKAHKEGAETCLEDRSPEKEQQE